MRFEISYVKRLLLFTAIPVVAIIIALRQGYLNVFHHLSTWKGGGMGMFAGADHASNRFLRVYIEFPDGTRQPVIKFTSGQEHLVEQALWYPSDAIFEELARSLRRTKLIAADQQVAVYKRDSAGKRTASSGKSYYQVNAVGPPVETRDPEWALTIEFWQISFDTETNLAKATLTKTKRFRKGDL